MYNILPVRLLLLVLLVAGLNASHYAVIDYKSTGVNISTLRLVQVIFRHGDRTPINPFPTDEYKDYWTIGYGELTNVIPNSTSLALKWGVPGHSIQGHCSFFLLHTRNYVPFDLLQINRFLSVVASISILVASFKRGKQQHYALGQYLRQRYTGFLNDSYWANQVHVNSTDLDRTLSSASSQLAGLFPPSGDEVWDTELLWQPIPIHTLPVPIDLVLDPDSICPIYNDESDRVFASPEMQAIDAENKDLYEYLTNNTGTLVDDIIQTGYIYDTIMIEKLYNLTSPAWVDPVYDQMHNLSDLGFIWRYKTPLEQRLKGGGILKRILENSYRKSSGVSPYSLHLYSSHDTLVSAVLNGLKVFNGIAPPYASAIIFDLHEPLPDQYAIQVSYYNDTSVEPYVYAIPGCTDLCPLDTFSLLIKDLLPVDLFKECNVTIDTLADIYRHY